MLPFDPVGELPEGEETGEERRHREDLERDARNAHEVVGADRGRRDAIVEVGVDLLEDVHHDEDRDEEEEPRGERRAIGLAESNAMTARSTERLLRVARTIADLAGAERVDVEHLEEAARFRPPAPDPSAAAHGAA